MNIGFFDEYDKIYFEFMVYCDCDGLLEPEGGVLFDYTPERGEGMILSDGHLWKIHEVDPIDNRVVVKRAEK